MYSNEYATINTKAIAQMSNSQRLDMLAQLIAWADSEEGADYRAGQSVVRPYVPATAEDVLALMDEDAALEVQILMGNLL